MPFFPDCYDQWSLVKYVYDGDHKTYFDTLFEGTEKSAVSMLMKTTLTRSKLTCA